MLIPGLIGLPGPMEMMIIGVIALLLFGKRLPEVARSLGKGFVEFKKGIRGIALADSVACVPPPRNTSRWFLVLNA